MFKFPNYNIILPKYLEIVKKKGSSLALPANGLGGSRATSLLVAHFALQNTASNSAKKKNRPREGVAEGGLGGIQNRRHFVPTNIFASEPDFWRGTIYEVITFF